MERLRTLFTRRRPRPRRNKNVQLEPGPYNAYTLKQELKQQLKEEHIKLMDTIQKLEEQDEINSTRNGQIRIVKGELNNQRHLFGLYKRTLKTINLIERQLNIELTGDLWRQISDNKQSNEDHRKRISEQIKKDHRIALGLGSVHPSASASALQARLQQQMRLQNSSRTHQTRSHQSRSRQPRVRFNNGYNNNNMQHVMNLSMGVQNPMRHQGQVNLNRGSKSTKSKSKKREIVL
jgi:hypothetical protein